MASDLRYMKLGRGAGSTWFFVYNIPTELRGHPRFITSRGKPMTKITESLGTTDPEKGRELRDQRLVYWNRQFRMLREGASDDDIREEAIALYRAATIARKETDAEVATLQAQRLKLPDDYLGRLDRAIEIGAADHIKDFCRRIGIALEPQTERYRKVGLEFLRALTAGGHFAAMLPTPEGDLLLGWNQPSPLATQIAPPVSRPKPPPVPVPLSSATETFSEALEKYLATELDGTSADTITDYRRKVKVFTDKVGDLPLGQITDHVAVAFLDDYLLHERKQKPMTRNTYAMLFSAVFKCAIRRKKAKSNPFEGQRIKQVAVHYQPFTDQEIAALFADAKFETAPVKHKTATALPWASLISAYTGCRLEEVAQLRAADIKETDGIWYFEFCHDGNGKTQAATRTVPLHHALIDRGLLRYRDHLAKDSMLFPGLRDRDSKPGRLGPKLGDAFSWWRKQLGIIRPGLNFHSFRHTVGDRLRKAGVPEDDRAALLGHEDERITSRVYGHDGPGLYRLQLIVEKISYGVSR
jgi:integrase